MTAVAPASLATHKPVASHGITPTQNQMTSDNQSAVCPEALEGFLAANAAGHVPSYGDDPWTARAANLLRETFETNDCEVFFCFNGTSANSMTIAHLCQSYNSVICHEVAHIETDECGAPEFFANGAKLLTTSSPEGKVLPEGVKAIVEKRKDIHYPRPRVLSLTQATEVGTIYSPDEIKALTSVAKASGIRTHMDGARFSNAVASLGVTPAEITWKAGVDALCFGGTKIGLPIGEAVIFFNHELARDFDYRCKQSGQLASKMRFLTAPWVSMLETGAWLKYGKHGNAMAKLLGEKLNGVTGVQVVNRIQANSVFLKLDPHVLAALREKGWTFYTFIGGNARLMMSWDTTTADVERFVSDARSAMA